MVELMLRRMEYKGSFNGASIPVALRSRPGFAEGNFSGQSMPLLQMTVSQWEPK